MNVHSQKREICLGTCLAALALVSLACGFDVQLPVTRIETGPTQTVDIRLPLPEDPAGGVQLILEFAGGELTLAPGASDSLARGTATYNVPEFAPETSTDGDTYTLRSGDMEIEAIPVFTDEVTNRWELELADTPISLVIRAGGYTGNFELGGLSLKELSISDGGASVKGAFSEPNNIEMSSFTYSTGASSAELSGLANANFTRMQFTAGAGDYTLRFDGILQRDASVTIESGVGTLSIIVPQGTNTSLSSDSGLTSIQIAGEWAQNGNVYTLSGSGPTLTFLVKMGVGTLNLETE